VGRIVIVVDVESTLQFVDVTVCRNVRVLNIALLTVMTHVPAVTLPM
jgi:hypothetical protein